MKRFHITLFCIIASLQIAAGQDRDIHVFAHRGCWSKDAEGAFIVPENSIAAVAEAARRGYEGIECDVRLTKDGRMVILHDGTLNRTLRRADDYSRLTEKTYLKDLTFEELRRDYVMESADPEMRTPVPTLEELLLECKRQSIVPMLHSKIWKSYEVAQQIFGDDWICFTGGVEKMQASVFPFEHEKNAIDNGITYLLTDRVLPSRKWKRIKIRH